MTGEINELKRNLAAGKVQFGIWCSAGSAVVTEVIAGAGADWLLIDMEHSPNHTGGVLAQLHASAGHATEPVVRVPSHDPVVIKRMLDMGARSLMVPNVRSVAEARAIVAATRYPPDGNRGISLIQRGNRYGRWTRDPADNICLILQSETREAVEAVEAIAAIEGVDAVFVGPADLSADLGHVGDIGAEPVQNAIRAVLQGTAKAGKAPGILAFDRDAAQRYIDWGVRMIAVGSDLDMLAGGSDRLITGWREPN